VGSQPLSWDDHSERAHGVDVWRTILGETNIWIVSVSFVGEVCWQSDYREGALGGTACGDAEDLFQRNDIDT
jgi:hypothetical protein